MAPTPVLLPGKSHGRRSLVGYSPWGPEESDTTERLHFHFSLSRSGEGNGNPLQCSCLENPRDSRAWWLSSMGSHRVGHDWRDLAAACTLTTVKFQWLKTTWVYFSHATRPLQFGFNTRLHFSYSGTQTDWAATFWKLACPRNRGKHNGELAIKASA